MSMLCLKVPEAYVEFNTKNKLDFVQNTLSGKKCLF